MPIQFFPLCQLFSDVYDDPSNPPGSADFLPFYRKLERRLRRKKTPLHLVSFTLKIVDAVGTSKDIRIGGEEHDIMLVFSGTRRCEVVQSTTSGRQLLRGGDCWDDTVGRLILQPCPPTVIQQIAAKLLYPYPQLVDMEKEICMS